MKYKVRVSDLCYGEATVETKSEAEAKEKSENMEINYFDRERLDSEVEPVTEKISDDMRTYIVTEVCPHCESEIEMRWNTDVDGFKAFCPVCGKRLMLCDECRHCDGGCDYNHENDSCKHNPTPDKQPIKKEKEPNPDIGELAIRRVLNEETRKQGVYLPVNGKMEVFSLHITHNKEVIITDFSDYTKIYSIQSLEYWQARQNQ